MWLIVCNNLFSTLFAILRVGYSNITFSLPHSAVKYVEKPLDALVSVGWILHYEIYSQLLRLCRATCANLTMQFLRIGLLYLYL